MKSEDLQFPIVSNALKKCTRKKVPKNLPNVLDNDENLESYHYVKDKIEEIYEKKQKAQE